MKETATDAQTKVVTSGQDRVKRAISGQVHRAINIVDDGKDTRSYFVDVDNTNSRVRFIGTAKVNDDMAIGAKFEVAIAPNESSEVSQEDQEINDFIDQRWAEVSLHSKRFDKLRIKGSGVRRQR